MSSHETNTSDGLTVADASASHNETNPAINGDAIIQPKRPSRNIVILLDGTSNQFSAKNSNVIKLMSVLQADEKQLLYYSSGIGEQSLLSLSMLSSVVSAQHR